MGFFSKLVRSKSVAQLQTEAGASRDFRRTMGVWQLTAIGVGAIVGVGVFVLAPNEAALNAGPAIILSFLVAGIGSACAALSYAEFAGMIPVTGSAYTYGYAVLGELPAWIIGWDLLVEYALIVGVVAAGTSNYLQSLIAQITGLHLPVFLQAAYDPAHPDSGRGINLIAMLVALGVAALQVARTEVGARFNTVVVALKVLGVIVVVVVGGMGSIPGAYAAALLISEIKAICIWLGVVDVFGLSVSFSKLTLVVDFLVMAVVPTFTFLTELGLRWEASIQVLELYSANTVGIFAASFAIWLINLIIPALIGSLLIVSIKLFKSR